ncbi:MAG: hypothetical protein K2Z81_09140, partial [Cyanobacteria bacterium]|nr:hypothetical protein [Cyanobacteriota bacterium]
MSHDNRISHVPKGKGSTASVSPSIPEGHVGGEKEQPVGFDARSAMSNVVQGGKVQALPDSEQRRGEQPKVTPESRIVSPDLADVGKVSALPAAKGGLDATQSSVSEGRSVVPNVVDAGKISERGTRRNEILHLTPGERSASDTAACTDGRSVNKAGRQAPKSGITTGDDGPADSLLTLVDDMEKGKARGGSLTEIAKRLGMAGLGTRRGFKAEITESGTYVVEQGQSSQRLQAFMSSGTHKIIAPDLEIESDESMTAQSGSNESVEKGADESAHHRGSAQAEPARPFYIVKEGESLEFIAVAKLNDSRLAELIERINAPLLKSLVGSRSARTQALPPGTMLLLPHERDIAEFRSKERR